MEPIAELAVTVHACERQGGRMTVRIRGKPRDVIFISSIKSLRLSKNLLLQFTATGNVANLFSAGSTHVADDALPGDASSSELCRPSQRACAPLGISSSSVVARAMRFRVLLKCDRPSTYHNGNIFESP